MVWKALDLQGQRFGRLVGIRRVESSNVKARWLLRCDCGREHEAVVGNLRSGSVRSCGCMSAERRRKQLVGNDYTRTHGHCSGYSDSPTYSSWQGMINRCTNERVDEYPRYGGRGITVCDRWRDSFKSFLADMGERHAGHTIDRIDGNGHYEPGNCRWATAADQRRNQKRVKLSTERANEILGRLEHGEHPVSIAARFGIARCTVDDVRARRCYREVDPFVGHPAVPR